jgi:CDP-paratose 2-epimerase
MGGSRHSNCSMIEAIEMCEAITGKKLDYSYTETNRIGDHIWWISDVSKFKSHYPDWNYKYDVKGILTDIYEHASFSEHGPVDKNSCM